MNGPFTTADIARRFNVAPWQARRIFERGMVPDPGRVCRVRAIPESDLPAVERALIAAGYLKDRPTSAA